MRRLVLLALLTALLPAARAGEIPYRGVGARVAALGDLDGDGKPEFAAATRDPAKAEVFIVSTTTGRALWQADAHDAAALPDQDGDGKPDVVLALRFSETTAWAAVCRGVTGKRLALVSPPKQMDVGSGPDNVAFSDAVSVLDADGDAKPDLLVIRALPSSFRPGSGVSALLQPWCEKAEAFVVGLDGKILADLDAAVNSDFRSAVAAPAGDADGDGRADVFVDVSYEASKVPVQLRSLGKGVLLKFKGEGTRSPDAVVACGDLDGDQKPDFLFGSHSVRRGNADFAGEVRVMSGKDGHEIRAVKGAKEGDNLGLSVVALPDIDGDGVGDFAAGAPGMEPKKGLGLAGGVVAFSGKTGKVLWTAKGEVASGSLGTSLAVLSDVDGDGVPDLVAGAPGYGPDDKGQALVLSGKTGKTLLTFDGN